MVEQKKFHWLKLHSNFFTDKHIRKMNTLENGDRCVLAYLRMILLAIDTDGEIEYIGLEDNPVAEIAFILEEDEEVIRSVADFIINYNMGEFTPGGNLVIYSAIEYTGEEKSSAQRVRQFRSKKKAETTTPFSDVISGKTECNTDVTDCNVTPALQCNNDVTACNNNVTLQCNTEKEIEIEKDKELYSEREEEEEEARLYECEDFALEDEELWSITECPPPEASPSDFISASLSLNTDIYPDSDSTASPDKKTDGQSFNLGGGLVVSFSDSETEALKNNYPLVNVPSQLEDVRVWLNKNPERIKSKSALTGVINRWLNEKQKKAEVKYHHFKGAEPNSVQYEKETSDAMQRIIEQANTSVPKVRKRQRR